MPAPKRSSGSRASSATRRRRRRRRRCSSSSTGSTSVQRWSGCGRRRWSCTGAAIARSRIGSGGEPARRPPAARCVRLGGGAASPGVGVRRAIPYRLGRELAAALPDATFVPLAGGAHFPWFDDADSVVRALRTALGPERPEPPAGETSATLFSRREREVLGLLAQGLTDKEIAEQLVLSRHTVHRHVANIRRKLGRDTRTAAVAEEARLGLL